MMWLWSEGEPGWWTNGRLRWGSWSMRVDRHVVGVNGVVCVWPLAFKMKRVALGSFKPETRHQTLNVVWFWTVGCLVYVGYISCWILRRSVVVGRDMGCILFKTMLWYVSWKLWLKVVTFPPLQISVFPTHFAFTLSSLTPYVIFMNSQCAHYLTSVKHT